MAWLMLSSLIFETAMKTDRITTVIATRLLSRLSSPSVLTSASICPPDPSRVQLSGRPRDLLQCRSGVMASVNERRPMKFTWIAGIIATIAAATPSQALDKVRFGTNWVAEAEHGGFYQAVADGTYKKHGLDVAI